MILGYARVSTKEQNIESQLRELESLGAEKSSQTLAVVKTKIELSLKTFLSIYEKEIPY